MIAVLGSRQGMTRRAALAASGLAVAGLAAGTPPSAAKAKHVVVIYLLGGAATQDMFDLKPDAPKEVRGEFKPIASSAPGVMVSEHLPRLAKWMHKACVIRSTTHKAGCHNPMPSYCGSEQPLPDIVSTSDSYPPSMGSVCEYLRQHGPRARRDLPEYVYLPCYLGWGQAIRRPGPYAGWLGKSCDALHTECLPTLDPGKTCLPGQPQYVRGAPFLPEAASAVTLDRLDGRKTLLEQLEAKARTAEKAYSRQQERAFQLLSSGKVRAAFDIGKEPPALRDAYGRTMFGSSVLIARRLIEAGVRFVNASWDIFWDRHRIDYDAWDTHTRNFMILKEWNLPQFDRTMSAFLADLDARGLLDETLVLVTSEMGRTPKVNGSAGRDHWTHCYSTFLAGAGLKGGTVVGASDGHAAYVKDRPVRPADICATVYRALGLDHTMMLPDRSGRPNSIDHGGEPVREALA
ncbi:MAG: DUF1501 domain-containing protein [Gemmataceae bacterium]|nr:DUF1501 domain-containing protein [Gemmataceae bacterium]